MLIKQISGYYQYKKKIFLLSQSKTGVEKREKFLTRHKFTDLLNFQRVKFLVF